ncbi:energy-dependent translational throttle protein EttA [Sciscionella marina]|uniref:energy-dependent translational throttle protein EttA n=1 Tax=Sciscionella marina TaxID=508770 RepID=UPI000477C6E2|nr:energy-dependent translational throttle protein EttA [Sciscionella marina]
MRTILQLNRIRVARGGRVLLDDVTLALLSGARIGVVGSNGAGKSTALRIMGGLDPPSGGEITLSPEATRAVLLQEPQLDDTTTVLGNVEEGVRRTRNMLSRFHELTGQLAHSATEHALEELGALQERLDQVGAWDLDARLGQAMQALRCPPADMAVRSLSGGERRRVALCRLLLARPDLLLLDEPTNHLDAESVEWLEGHLESYPGTVVAVTHDRYFLDNVAEWILEIDRGHAYIYQGNYSNYLHEKQARLDGRQRKDAKRRKHLQEELSWGRAGPKGRRAKARARLSRYEEMMSAATTARAVDPEEIQIPPGSRLGSSVIEAEHVSKSLGERHLIRDLSFSLPRNGIVGMIGPNGVGKTTLFTMIAGVLSPDEGRIRLGESVRLSYVDQQRTGMEPDKTAWELVAAGENYVTVGKVDIPSRAYLAAFGFTGTDQQKPARLFSGGERTRLNLALTLKQGGNVLLLDEPTNDLDIETLRSLESALLAFPGCVVVATHDRWFLDRITTHILAWEGTPEDPARWFWFEGNYAAYEHNKYSRLGGEATRAHHDIHRKLTRD